VIKAQIQLDRMVLQPSSDLSPPQIRDVLWSLEAYQNQAIISKWARSRTTIADLITQIQYLRSQNELIQKQLKEDRKTTRLAK
jgi:hypothetical protein